MSTARHIQSKGQQSWNRRLSLRYGDVHNLSVREAIHHTLRFTECQASGAQPLDQIDGSREWKDQRQPKRHGRLRKDWRRVSLAPWDAAACEAALNRFSHG